MRAYCPCCKQWHDKPTEGEAEENWRLMELYYEIGGGVVWAPPRVGFDNRESAEKFKASSDKAVFTRWDVSYFVKAEG